MTLCARAIVGDQAIFIHVCAWPTITQSVKHKKTWKNIKTWKTTADWPNRLTLRYNSVKLVEKTSIPKTRSHFFQRDCLQRSSRTAAHLSSDQFMCCEQALTLLTVFNHTRPRHYYRGLKYRRWRCRKCYLHRDDAVVGADVLDVGVGTAVAKLVDVLVAINTYVDEP